MFRFVGAFLHQLRFAHRFVLFGHEHRRLSLLGFRLFVFLFDIYIIRFLLLLLRFVLRWKNVNRNRNDHWPKTTTNMETSTDFESSRNVLRFLFAFRSFGGFDGRLRTTNKFNLRKGEKRRPTSLLFFSTRLSELCPFFVVVVALEGTVEASLLRRKIVRSPFNA